MFNSDIIDYLTGAGIKVLKVVCLSSVNAPHRSFKLSVSPADYEKVFNEELWEEGSRVREWSTWSVVLILFLLIVDPLICLYTLVHLYIFLFILFFIRKLVTVVYFTDIVH